MYSGGVVINRIAYSLPPSCYNNWMRGEMEPNDFNGKAHLNMSLTIDRTLFSNETLIRVSEKNFPTSNIVGYSSAIEDDLIPHYTEVLSILN